MFSSVFFFSLASCLLLFVPKNTKEKKTPLNDSIIPQIYRSVTFYNEEKKCYSGQILKLLVITGNFSFYCEMIKRVYISRRLKLLKHYIFPGTDIKKRLTKVNLQRGQAMKKTMNRQQ